LFTNPSGCFNSYVDRFTTHFSRVCSDLQIDSASGLLDIFNAITSRLTQSPHTAYVQFWEQLIYDTYSTSSLLPTTELDNDLSSTSSSLSSSLSSPLPPIPFESDHIDQIDDGPRYDPTRDDLNLFQSQPATSSCHTTSAIPLRYCTAVLASKPRLPNLSEFQSLRLTPPLSTSDPNQQTNHSYDISRLISSPLVLTAQTTTQSFVLDLSLNTEKHPSFIGQFPQHRANDDNHYHETPSITTTTTTTTTTTIANPSQIVVKSMFS
jgi:hypothetical protein